MASAFVPAKMISPAPLNSKASLVQAPAKKPLIAAPAESSLYNWDKYGLGYYLNGALAGGICCSVTHGGMCPVDVVKTRIQLDPVTYNQGLFGGMKKVVAEEGAGALATGLGPTAIGYFIQGWFKFGGFEFFKIKLAKALGDQSAWDNRNVIYLGASACAEFIADIFLCPLEATRIRQVSDEAMSKLSMPAAFSTILAKDGLIGGFYSGFVPILFKQVPYTMAKFAVQGAAAERIFSTLPDRSTLGKGTKMGVSMVSGVIAGVAAAIISHPADTLLSKINKAGAGGEGGMMTRLGRIASEMGVVNLCLTGLPARCFMIGTLTAGQFVIFDTLMPIMGAEKFHFENPAAPGHH
jgi:solute carrier family 25 phosphate transporter 3